MQIDVDEAAEDLDHLISPEEVAAGGDGEAAAECPCGSQPNKEEAMRGKAEWYSRRRCC